ncbi:transcriptional regulator [Afipia carboxidovorans OM4]|uniref:TetR/AcrR family transcriptional regulator n=1 Tax=Afipia carboxidovorans TaxID=40137 RepID=UPI000212ACCB|nr:TetR/AcrR family transcriptional regulator [Afipia carboxidovorans]AEI02925.1 transcriptional regulator [Afipia carboxidovorans OM4]
MVEKRQSRREAVNEHKRDLILAAAGQVFAEEGLEGASLRAIAVRAGYTPAALYFHFESKEDIYAEVLEASLASLGAAVDLAVAKASTPAQKLKAAATAFFRFYAENPRDLDLGFYLFRGGMKRAGSRARREAECGAGSGAAANRGSCGESRRITAEGQPPDGRLLCPCHRASPVAAHWAYPDVRCLGA